MSVCNKKIWEDEDNQEDINIQLIPNTESEETEDDDFQEFPGIASE